MKKSICNLKIIRLFLLTLISILFFYDINFALNNDLKVVDNIKISDSSGNTILKKGDGNEIGIINDEIDGKQKLLYILKEIGKREYFLNDEDDECGEGWEGIPIYRCLFFDLNGKNIGLNVENIIDFKINDNRLFYNRIDEEILKRENHVFDIRTKEDIKIGNYSEVRVCGNVYVLVSYDYSLDNDDDYNYNISFYKDKGVKKQLKEYRFDRVVKIDGKNYYKVYKDIDYWDKGNDAFHNDFYYRRFFNLLDENFEFVLKDFVDEGNTKTIDEKYVDLIDYKKVINENKCIDNKFIEKNSFYVNVYEIVNANDDILYSKKENKKYFLVNKNGKRISKKYNTKVISRNRFLDTGEFIYVFDLNSTTRWGGVLYYKNGNVKEYSIKEKGSMVRITKYGYYMSQYDDKKTTINNFLKKVKIKPLVNHYYWVDVVKGKDDCWYFIGKRFSSKHLWDIYYTNGNLVYEGIEEGDKKWQGIMGS